MMVLTRIASVLASTVVVTLYVPAGAASGFNTTSGEGMMNWTALVSASYSPYYAVFGNLAAVLIFAIPFLMAWIRQRDMTVPGILGIILGLFIILRLPAEFHQIAATFITFSVVAVVFTLFKER